MLNNVNLCGRLTADPELKTTPNGVSVATFSLAVDRDYAPKGEEKQCDFINIVAWRNTAEFICKYFGKGKLIIINGTIQTRNYTANDGSKRYITEVVANNVYFAGDKSNATTTPNFSPDISVDEFEEIDISEKPLPF